MKFIKKIRVLIVDDYPDIRFTLSAILKRKLSDCTIATAESGEQAIEMLRTQTYDVIFMDIMMRGLTGIQTSQMIREELVNNTPIAFISAKVDKQTKEQCLTYSKFFIEKPFVWEDIQKTLNEIIL